MNGETGKLLKSLAIDREAHAAAEAAEAQAMKTKLLVGGALLVGALLAGAAVWVLKPGAAEGTATVATATETAAPSGEKAPAARMPAGSLIASGFVVARRQATVAAQIVGEVRTVEVEEGQAVKAGQVVARLDADAAAADLARARANTNAVNADLVEARRILDRTRTLQKSGFATEAALTNAEARVHVLEAQAKAAETAVNAARVQFDRYTIRAPFDGIVTNKAAQPGEIISPMSAGGGFTRTGICTIVDMDSLEVEVDVNEALIARVRAGQTAEAVLDAYPDWRIPARVIAIVPTAQRDKATVRVRVGFDQKDARILPEMAVKVTFLENDKAA